MAEQSKLDAGERVGYAARSPAQRDDLVDSIVRALEVRGIPSGTWLVDVVQVRQALRDADDLMRRLEEAIIRAASPAARDAS
jgi:hypothetical protein